VKVTGTQGNWQLTLNAQPYYIKGLDYGPDLKTTQSTTNAYVADLAATGANTTRTWGTGSTSANLLTAVDKYYAAPDWAKSALLTTFNRPYTMPTAASTRPNAQGR
jgi:hypothetical protein